MIFTVKKTMTFTLLALMALNTKGKAVTSDNENLLTNSSMEKVKKNWRFRRFANSNATGKFSKTNTYDGQTSLNIDSPDENGVANWSQVIPISPSQCGKTYKFSVFAKTQALSGSTWISIYKIDDKGKITWLSMSQKISGNQNFRELYTFTQIPKNTKKLLFMLRLEKAKGSAWYDSASVKEAENKCSFKLLDHPKKTFQAKSVRASCFEKVAVLRAVLDNTEGFAEVKLSYIVRDAHNKKALHKVCIYKPVIPGKNRLHLDWNPMTIYDKLTYKKDSSQVTIDILVEKGKAILFKKSYPVTLNGIKKIVKETEKNNRVVTAEHYSKIIKGNTLYGSVAYITNDVGFTADKSYLNNINKCGGDFVDARISWSELEPSSNEFSWELSDKFIKWAEELGVPIVYHVSWGASSYPKWLRKPEYLAAANNGKFKYNHAPNGSFSSEAFQQAFLKMVKTVMNRYKNKKVIIGWQFSPNHNDMLYPETPFWGIESGKPYLLDYSEHFRKAFCEYLKKKYTLEELNKLYASNYKSFADIKLPTPQWEKRLDRRAQWWDFQNFKAIAVRDIKEKQFAMMRQIDPERIIISWGLRRGPLEIFLEPLKKYNVVFNVSIFGVTGHDHMAYLSRRYGVKCINENYMDQPIIKRYLLDAIMYQVLASGGVGHIGMRAWFNTGVYKANGLFARWNKLLKKLVGCQPVYEGVALLSSYATALCREKTFRNSYYPRGNLKHKNSLPLIKTLEYSGFGYDWVSDYDKNERLPFAMVIDCGSEVLPSNFIDKLVDYVKTGGTVVAFADSGNLLPVKQKSETDYALLDKLGFPVKLLSKSQKKKVLSKTSKNWQSIKNLEVYDCLELKSKLSSKFQMTAQTDDEKSGIITWKYGKGTVCFVTGIVNWQPPYNQEFLKKLCNLTGVKRGTEIEGGSNIKNVLLRKGKAFYGVTYNDSPKTQNVTIKFNLPVTSSKYNIREMFDGTPVKYKSTTTGPAISYKLKGKTTSVFEILPEAK